ncbi:MAG: serpin family protein [Promethearchaeota archaeon]
MQDQSTSTSSNLFAIELYKQLKKPEENLFVSPLSIFTAMTMIYVGARGSTEEEIKDILHLSIPQRRLPMQVKTLNDILRSHEETIIKMANSIWTDLGYELNESFLYVIDENYEGALYKENFSDIEGTCDKINAWVSKNTEQKIKGIITPNSFDPNIRLILLNAIYFNGKWANPFKKDLTKDAPFFLEDGSSIQIPMMHQKETFSYYENEELQILEIPYKNTLLFGTNMYYSMIIILPRDKKGLEEIEKTLTLESISKQLEQFQQEEVKVYIPKFKIETKYELKKDLREMGMTESFTSNANFSGIVDTSKSEPPFIGEIIHKAFVDVNEEGTEAAAVTMITALPKGMPIHKEIPEFKADHPFMFMIQDSQTKSILFIGRISNPKEN